MIQVNWTMDDPGNFDHDDSLAENAFLALMEDRQLLVGVMLAIPGRDPYEPFPELEGLLRHWAKARKTELVGLEGDFWNTDIWKAYFSLPLRHRTVEEAATFAADAAAIADAYIDGTPTPNVFVGLLESGHAQALLGLSESQSLECKRSLELDREHAKLNLAKDIAAIANSETDGLIVIGLETRRRRGEDYIAALHPIPDAGNFVRRARRIADRFIYPPIDGLVIKAVPVGTTPNRVIYCLIPKQAAELKPFLVAGAFVDGKVEGALISVPRRRNDETIHLTPASIHAFMAAGYALFRNAEKSKPSVPTPSRLPSTRPPGERAAARPATSSGP
ncbi:AlbA family DNA-binding domain-containing protein [Micromonospora thermarum]|uniref:Schlafen AlbA-2 domain-containing protein n=1 Tax=Micromonospora thermarum TaxID=2720024 RepID=A0ABX0YZY4_9ACTN|nr:RNA-binding domain-containing protein [Micromonospora thermarum]NJP30684.1 hypothetical protein [Micromonospora thermarum]